MDMSRSGGRGAEHAKPVPCAPVAALATLPVGPALSTALSELALSALTGFELVLVLKARNRQGNHERGLLLETVGEVMRRKDPDFGGVDDQEDDEFPVDGRRGISDEIGANEIRAALALTRRGANNLCGLARDLVVRLPAVLSAI